MGDIQDLLKRMNEAKTIPSEKCTDGKEHLFNHVMHADGAEYFYNYYECEKCKEIMVHKNKRKGINKMLWS
jgi:hypothetical protein